MRTSLRSKMSATLVAMLLGALLVRLGYWQIDRAEEKEQRFSAFNQRRSSPPVKLRDLQTSVPEDLYWRRVQLRGRFGANTFLLDNRVQAGQVGFEVLSQFETASGAQLLIDRGWVAAGGNRQTIPAIVTPADTLKLTGHIGPVPVTGLKFNAAADSIETLASGLSRIQNVELEMLAERYDLPLLPYVVYLDEASPGGFNRQWIPPGNGAEKHGAYALQWFSMAAVLCVMYLVFLKRAT